MVAFCVHGVVQMNQFQDLEVLYKVFKTGPVLSGLFVAYPVRAKEKR